MICYQNFFLKEEKKGFFAAFLTKILGFSISFFMCSSSNE
jgi:hypothetical protein